MCSTNAQDEALGEVKQEPAARKLPELKHFCFHRQEPWELLHGGSSRRVPVAQSHAPASGGDVCSHHRQR